MTEQQVDEMWIGKGAYTHMPNQINKKQKRNEWKEAEKSIEMLVPKAITKFEN